MAQNRGYQGPAFSAGRNGRRPSHFSNDENHLGVDSEGGYLHNRSNLSATESRTSNANRRSLLNESGFSHRSNATAGDSRSVRRHDANLEHSDKVTPLHDPAGKPLRRHGTETIGDLLLHPLKELQLHTKRLEAYEVEKNEWNEKHPESIASAKDVNTTQEPIIEVRVRLTMHFRHLVGDQDVKFTDEIVSAMKEPLRLTSEEEERIKTFKDTDDFIDFLDRTKRDFSVKVHKTVAFRAGLAQLDSDSSGSSLGLGEKTNTEISGTTVKSTNEKQSVQKSDSATFHDKSRPHKNQAPDDVVIDLNQNVYVQIQFMQEVKEEEMKQRKAFFVVPDPDLSDEIGEETSATWVELFGDVFYVGWITNFTHSIHINSVGTLGTYAAWFVVMWWTWCSSALYSSRYDRGDVAHHLYKIIELCGLIIMAGSSGQENFEKNPRMFIIGYIIMKSVVLFEYLVVFAVSLGAHFRSSRQPLGIYVAASAISIAMWGASLMFTSVQDMSKRYALWYVSIGMELIVHIFLQSNSRVSLAASHLGERFGLFTLIILGENCMGFIQMVSESDQTSTAIACNVFGVTIIFCYFFMYFDDFSGEFMSKTKLSQLWMYLHFPLHLFQVAFGISLTNVISAHNKHQDTAQSGATAEQTTTEHAAASPLNATTHAIASHFTRLSAEASASTTGHESAEDSDPMFVIKTFWITAGLILCFNAFIKWVNTPVKGAHLRSHIICVSRILNAVVFFALSVTNYAQLDGLSMLAIMMACLLFQSAVDLLD